jgi:hypothetical protein
MHRQRATVLCLQRLALRQADIDIIGMLKVAQKVLTIVRVSKDSAESVNSS